MEENNRFTVVIDIENIHNLLTNNPHYYGATNNSTIGSRRNPSSISKVSEQIRKSNRSSYEPVAVSIEPYHYGKQSLRFMEKTKWRFLEYILATNKRKSLDDYLKVVWEIYPLARRYYSPEIKIESNRFVQMLLLDGLFFLKVVCVMDYIPDGPGFSIEENDNGNQIPWQYYFFVNDLLLAKNQIPFIVVEKIYKLIMGDESSTSLLDEISDFVDRTLCNYPKAICKPDRTRTFDHLLHLCHIYLKPSQNYDYIAAQLNCGCQPLCQWYRASEYNVAGVTFEKRVFDENNHRSLLDVSFSGDVLEIPYFIIDENIITIFRNLVAFEKSNPQFGNDITAYIFFLSGLIHSAEDVELLVDKGIIEHHFQSHEEVVDMLIELSAGVEFNFVGSFYLQTACQILGELHDNRLRRWKEWFRRSSTIFRDCILNS